MLRPLLRLAAPILLLAFASPAFAVFGSKPVGDTDLLARSLAAVLYRTADGAHLCTAVVLAPRLVLTAAHCTEGDRGDIKVIFSSTLTGVPADRLRGARAVAKPERTAEAKGSYAYNDPDDIGLVLLDAAAPADTLAVRLATSGAADVRIAGYGATADLRTPNAQGKRQLGFGQGLRAATATLVAKGPVFIGAQGGDAGMCTGDSGGPAFVAEKDGVTVVGLLIGVSASRDAADYCRGTAWYASIPRWHDWIERSAANLGVPLR
jgi:secreted trypsin-like serine protease